MFVAAPVSGRQTNVVEAQGNRKQKIIEEHLYFLIWPKVKVILDRAGTLNFKRKRNSLNNIELHTYIVCVT